MYPRFPLSVIERSDHQELGTSKRLRLAEARTAAIAEKIASLALTTPARNAIRVGERQEHTRNIGLGDGTLGERAARNPADALTQLCRDAAYALEPGAIHKCAARGITTQCLETTANVSVSAAGAALEHITFAEKRRKVAGLIMQVQISGTQEHVCEPWMHTKLEHVTTCRGDTPVRVEGVQTSEQFARLLIGRLRRRIEPAQLLRVRHVPGGEVQCQWREVGLEDLGRRLGFQRCLRALGPKPVAHARPQSSRASAALVGRCARHAQGLETTHAAGRIKSRAPYQARVDDRPHALDSETSLRDVGGEHDLACTP